MKILDQDGVSVKESEGKSTVRNFRTRRRAEVYTTSDV